MSDISVVEPLSALSTPCAVIGEEMLVVVITPCVDLKVDLLELLSVIGEVILVAVGEEMVRSPVVWIQLPLPAVHCDDHLHHHPVDNLLRFWIV